MVNQEDINYILRHNKSEKGLDVKRKICDEILKIMETYHRQEEERGYVDTPGGLQTMGDVWNLFLRWERELLE